ncbi:unnamed protein product [Blepharisma stoltei]|uniref:phosphoglucomutase (alpha-D-glucose-1,6-bisphosphate-dependent) n=1 Tax=Blepharisma stoltei TaxID=1481888 RepID=A0AAU9JVQ8_9CILI|nr:unnamed protein product [Blepharisma stoltei]
MSTIQAVHTTPIQGQKPGTSGVRKKVTEVLQPHYIENFTQSCFNTVKEREVLEGSTIVVSGDGRYYNKTAIQTILKVAAGNRVGRVWVGQNGILSTPAVSVIIREREGGIALGGLILTASHNPGGPNADFGIKYNIGNGGPAPEDWTNRIYEHTISISEYSIADIPDVDISSLGRTEFQVDGRPFVVEVIDSTEDYVAKMQSIFNFDDLRALVSRPDFKIHYDCLSGVSGPYARHIFHRILGVPLEQIKNSEPLEDFGGGHPDPNLVYAHDLVHAMGIGAEVQHGDYPDFGAANDGDADRNMILGKQFFVTPSDSVAVLAANSAAIPYFAGGLKGVARSMPTSTAIDFVGQKLGIQVYEVPTGWKFFGNLMDAGRLSICGEESFGTGSDHIREKDGVWAVLAWLSVIAYKNKNSDHLVGVEEIVRSHWQEYGRNYYMRYDYENVDSNAANQLMETLKNKFSEFQGQADSYEYTDPVDHSVTKNQGLRFITPEWRVIYRLSGTGSSGATVRVYYEKYEKVNLDLSTDQALGSIIDWSLKFSDINAILSVTGPTVIT